MIQISGFDDLLDPLYQPPAYQSAEPHVVGTSLAIRVTALDGDDTEIPLGSGYTATCTPTTPSGQAVATWTQTAVSGRQIVLDNGTVTMTASPSASQALFASYAGQTLRMTLLVTRTSDGATAAIWRECSLPIRPKLNP